MGIVQVGDKACNNNLASPKTLCWASQNVDQAFINSLIITVLPTPAPPKSPNLKPF